MLGGIFNKRKKSQELRNPSLQDIKKFRDTYVKYAELRQVETPPCFEKSIYKAIAGQKELHTIEFRLEDITDPQMIALAEALLEMPIVSSLDLRDNRITDDGAKALLEVLRLQIIAAKTPPTTDPRTKQPLYLPLPEYTRYVTSVNLKGNEVSASVLQELVQYMDVLRREDKRLEIRAALSRIDRNSDGGIDEEEFKGVLKLLTASTPTKKEIRAFMQQHTLSTDSTQNAVNLENVLLAKCAVSPSRHAASPPWEALVQERHAILGAPRMVPTRISTAPESTDPPSSTIRNSRPSFPSSGSDLETGKTNSFNSFSDITPVSSPSYQVAPVAPIEVAKPPPPPVVVTLAPPKVSESKNAVLTSDQPAAFSKPPAIPILPLASIVQHTGSVNPSPRSARLTGDEEWQRNSSLTGPNSVISTPSSPHDSDISDNMSIVSSAFGGSISQRVLDDHEYINPHTTSTVNPVTSNLDSPEHFSEDEASSGVVSAAREEAEELSAGEVDNDVRSSVLSHKPAKPATTGSNELDTKSASAPSLREASFPGNETPRELLSSKIEYSSAGHEEKRSLPVSVVSTPRFDDLSSLVFRGAEDHMTSSGEQAEDDEEVEECVDSLVVDVMKDGKERSVVKLRHSEFRTGLTVKDFPVELSFRNMLALLLPDNGLSHLALFAECRFPFVTVLDLSRNKLRKLPEDGLAVFPRLEVLNLAGNQLKAIAGLSKIFKLRALGLQQNAIRSVKNVEHLVQLEVLDLAHNQIATVHALRLLSLNNGLMHLHLEGNPVVETDERQKRKNIVHVRNLLPALQSLDSVPCVNLSSKDRKKANSVSSGKCLFESDLIPGYKALWVATACDTIHIFQDASSHSSSRSQQDDDEWDTRDEDGEDRPKKPLTREQQRQKDELRSRAIGFRSRGKAIPSPPKVKTSAYCFGPAQPPTTRRKKKKSTAADLSVVREQQRRASELSAPKHTPVDQIMMHQAQKRKSRVDFHQAMTVGERLQLAKDMTQRRPTATVLSARSRSILAKVESRKRASVVEATAVKEEATEEEEEEGPSKTASRSPSPQRRSPLKDAMVFRIDPTDTPRSPKGVLTFRVDPYPESSNPPPANCPKEADFLHDLAVSDFLNHAEEGFSTALTALNVLLSMCEKEQGDRKKLTDYRTSLDALDILNEHESKELYKKAQGHSENELQAQCADWFTKLGVVKKCMRQLLEKLEAHAPGSGVIRAYCRCIRSNELRGIITTTLEAQDEALNQPNDAVDIETRESEPEVPHTAENDLPGGNLQQDEPVSDSVTSQIFGDTSSQVLDEETSDLCTPDSATEPPCEERNTDFSIEDDLGFLEPTDSVFTEETSLDMAADDSVSQCMETTTTSLETDDHASVLDSEMDITMDIQMDVAVDSNQSIDEWETNTGEDNDEIVEASVAIEDDSAIEKLDEAIAIVNTENDDQVVVDEAEGHAVDNVPATSNEDDDWLATSTDLHAETAETDTFEQDLATVSGDEADGEIGQEQAEGQDYDWSNTHTTEATIEEEAEVSQEVYNGEEEAEVSQEAYNGEEEAEISQEVYETETYETEESYEVGETEENGEYSEEVATEEVGETEGQCELGDGVDADDEEAETFGDWEKGFDPNSNHYFWFNHTTGESSWTPPVGWPHEVDEPFSGEDAGTGEELQEQEYAYEEGTAEAQEYEEGGTEDQGYEEGPAEDQYYEEGAYEHGEGTEEGQYYEEETNETQYYEDPAYEGQTAEQGYEEGTTEEQQYEETTTDGQWYDETVAEGQEYVAEDGEQQLGGESPRRSEASDFEFDDSDLPGF